jgi:hypothetical protein
MDRLKAVLLLLILSGSLAQAKGLQRVVEWKIDSLPLHQRLADHHTFWVTTFQDRADHQQGFFNSIKPTELSFETIFTDKEQAPMNSTGDIVKALRENPGKHNLVCTGKAAADCLEALLQYPEMWEKVNYFVALDGKISGAEYAENSKPPVTTHDVQKASKLPLIKVFRFLVDSLTSLWDGHDPAVHSMSPAVRQAYLERHNARIEEMAEKVHMVSLVTEKGPYWKIPHSKTQYFVSY